MMPALNLLERRDVKETDAWYVGMVSLEPVKEMDKDIGYPVECVRNKERRLTMRGKLVGIAIQEDWSTKMTSG